jgi:hypothetical protein
MVRLTGIDAGASGSSWLGDAPNPARKLHLDLVDIDELPTPLTESKYKADTAAVSKKKGAGRLPKLEPSHRGHSRLAPHSDQDRKRP